MDINPVTQLYTDFITILRNSEIKYKTVADSYESVESKKNADAYIKAKLKEDVFETYYRYEPSVISKVMNISDEREIERYCNYRNEIPYNYRDEILNMQRQYIIDNYVEVNKYYRCLNGLPDINDEYIDFIFVDGEICKKYDIDSNIPVHLLSDAKIGILESIGYINELVSKYPTKSYLKYLGGNRIDVITSRRGKNFSLLKVPYNISESLLNTFMLIYEQCREYFMSCIYIPEYRSTIDYYDNFIALCIMVMSIQQVMARTIKGVIERDFFDVYCCKILFSVYGVPFFSDMDTATRTQMIQNLNMLVKNKGTNQVIYDIASILGYNRLEIYKYYLMKVRKFDDDGIPISFTKTNPVTGESEPDYKQMYDVYFQKAVVGDEDAYHSITSSSNRVSYTEITENDPYWIHDEQLEKELYETEYNYVESKYMGVGISYRMTKIIFENIYLLKMLLDKKDELPSIIVDVPKLTNKTVTLFDAVVILCAMVCKQNHLKGNILTDMSKILHVLDFKFSDEFQTLYNDTVSSNNRDGVRDIIYRDVDIKGINFSKSADEIVKEIKENKYIDNSLDDFFGDLTSYTIDRVNSLYDNYLNLYYELVEKMSTATDIKVYNAYKKFYNAIFYTKESREMFNTGTSDKPKYASTYMEYIMNTNSELYDLIENTKPENMYTNVNYIVSRIVSLMPEIRHLGFFDGHSNIMENMLWELIRFFKSYTTDLIDMSIVYIFDLKPDNILRLIEHASIHSNIVPRDIINISHTDYAQYISKLKYLTDNKFFNKIGIIHNTTMLFDTNEFLNIVNYIHGNIQTVDSNYIYDVFDDILSSIELVAGIFLSSLVHVMESSTYLKSDFKLNDMWKLISKIVYKDEIKNDDIIKYISELLKMDDIIHLKVGTLTNSYITNINIENVITDKLKEICKYISLHDEYGFIDNVSINSNSNCSDVFKLTDSCTVIHV